MARRTGSSPSAFIHVLAVKTADRKRSSRGFQVRIRGIGSKYFAFYPRRKGTLRRPTALLFALNYRDQLLRRGIQSPLCSVAQKVRFREVLG